MDIKDRRNKRRKYSETNNNRIEIIDNDEIEIITDENGSSYEPENKKKRDKKLTKGEKFFLIANIVVILGLIGYYGYRTFYYYNREHQKVDKITLKEKLTKIENITYKNDGLYEKDNIFYYKGKDVNNYVYYSGRMFRIISISDNIKMIEENNVTNIVYGMGEYKDSLIHTWLEDYIETYRDYDLHLVKSNWCKDAIVVDNYKCSNDLNDYIGLISTKEYLDAGGQDSYLNNSSYFWTINYDSNSAYFINNLGNINNYVKDTNNNYFSYGIRPVITISINTMYLSGSGTKYSPYVIEEEVPSILKNSSVGDYCLYKDMGFRIISIDEDGISLIMNDNLEIEKSYDDAIKYLNNEFIKKFNQDDLVKQDLITNLYNYDNQYNYREVTKKDSNYIIIPKIGDLFINNGDNYWLTTLSDKKVNAYYIMDNNMLFGDLKNKVHRIKPIIKLKGDLVIKEGIGTEDVPLILE